MGKRLLSSPKKRSPKKKTGTSLASNQTLKTRQSSGTVSVADMFSKQRQDQATKATKNARVSASAVIDLTTSPGKERKPDTVTGTSPYFSPSKDEGETSKATVKKGLPKLSLRRKLSVERENTRQSASYPENNDHVPDEDSEQNTTTTGAPAQKKARLSLSKKNRSTEDKSFESGIEDSVVFNDNEIGPKDQDQNISAPSEYFSCKCNCRTNSVRVFGFCCTVVLASFRKDHQVEQRHKRNFGFASRCGRK